MHLADAFVQSNLQDRNKVIHQRANNRCSTYRYNYKVLIMTQSLQQWRSPHHKHNTKGLFTPRMVTVKITIMRTTVHISIHING